MPSILITGANRGLGLEWARQYAEEGWRVFASCRHPGEAGELAELAARRSSLSVHRLDVTRADDIINLSVALQGEGIDVLLSNAGLYLEKYYEQGLGQLRYDDWLEVFRVNTLAAPRLIEAFSEHLARGERKLVVAITSHMGSIAEIEAPGSYYYRSSKAALNAVMKGMALELAPWHIGVLLLHPGWVLTRMGGPGARLTVAESVQGMRHLVERFTLRDSGRFLRYNGEEIPW